MTPDEAINQEWKRHYEDMRTQRDQALAQLQAIHVQGAPVAINLRVDEDRPKTIQEEIDEYRRTSGAPSTLKALVSAVIDLKCPSCHQPVPVTFET